MVNRSVATAEEQRPVKLLVRPRPDKGESLFGYIHRVGELNGLTSLRWISSMLSEAGLSIPDHKVQLLAESVGIDPEDLSTLTCRPIATQMANTLLFMDAYVPVALFRKQRSAICVECLRGRDATPAVWDLRLICVCVRHRRWLIDTCQRCGCALSWRRENLLRCRCGNDLTCSIQSNFDPPEAVLLFTKVLEAELRSELPFAEEAAARFSCFTTGRLIADSIAVFQQARSYVLWWCDQERMEVPRSTSSHCIDMATVRTMSKVLIDWPAALHAELRRCLKTTRAESYEFALIGKSEPMLTITPLHRLPRHLREVMGDGCVKSAYLEFCEQHKIAANDYRRRSGRPKRWTQFPTYNGG
ncbi:TniQ family protein [Cupriavidus basilensis]|uniref:TniQ family protein n=1 Tax=Cupriavidus basilensis TaxID=68895 RepID=UPI001243FAD2